MKRLLWLSTADARGHLMRCQLVTHRLRARGHDVQVVTTSREGQAFLAEFGVAADLLSEHYRVEFDARQNMQRLRTEWRMFRYLTSPRRFWRDLSWLERRARGASLLINDSFHPAVLLARRLRPATDLPPVVHVYGEHLRRAVEENYHGRWPDPLEPTYRRVIARSTDEAFARLEHSLDAPLGGREVGPRTYAVPPALASPTRPAKVTRRALHLAPHERLAVAYLNPHFADPAIAEALERAARGAGLRLHAIGEGFAGRQGWRPSDTGLVDAIAAADVFVSAPGVAALGQSLTLGVPFLALRTDQPEQEGNLRWLSNCGNPHRIVSLEAGRLAERLEAAVGELARAPRDRGGARPLKRAQTALDTWVRVLEQLLMDADGRRPPKEEIRWKAA